MEGKPRGRLRHRDYFRKLLQNTSKVDKIVESWKFLP